MELLKWNTDSQVIEVKKHNTNTISFVTAPKTDIWKTPKEWRKNAHFYYQETTDDFLVYVKFAGNYLAQYDQAGLMLRVDDDHWLKSGIELINGIPHVSAVVSTPYSDWSIVPLKGFTKENYLHLRIERKGPKILIDYFVQTPNFTVPSDINTLDWSFLRKVSYFSEAKTVQVGISAATPQGEKGFEVTFENFKIE